MTTGESVTTEDVVERVPELIETLERLQGEMRREHVERAGELGGVHATHRHGAANLVDYLVLRGHDIRPLQMALSELGLSSLGRAEEHVLTTVERVLATLYLIAGRTDGRRTEAAVGFGAGRRALEVHADALLGPVRHGRSTRIMVTMPTEAADDTGLVRALIGRGMGCARINCAHDDPVRWARMARNLRQAADELGQPCPILMDLPGPKVRTGPIEPGPRVLRLRPRRDDLGRPAEPARVRLVVDERANGGGPPELLESVIPVGRRWLDRLQLGDRVQLRDTRGDRRELVVVGRSDQDVDVEVWDTTYVVSGTELVAPGGHRETIGPLPSKEQALVLRVDDIVTLTADQSPARLPSTETGEDRARTRRPPGSPRYFRISCTLPAALDALQVGHRVLFDDGKISGRVVAVRPGERDVRITLASHSGSKLRAEKGINMPDSELRLPAFGEDDAPLLEFMVEHADMVGLSFAQSVEDVRSLQDRLDHLGGSLGIVLKIETARGFGALPELLMAAMHSERVGVMVARGDLAVECGFERLAEMQEEILWLCDAAHLPVIWATQVLDQMARIGQPSRAEVSDAAMSGRAECVMLNKGPHIVETVAALDDILRRMSTHQQKKVALLRRLRSWSPEEPSLGSAPPEAPGDAKVTAGDDG